MRNKFSLLSKLKMSCTSWVDICCEVHIHASSRIFPCSHIYYCQVQTFLSAQRLSQVSHLRGLVCVCVCVCTCVIYSIQYIEISIYLSSIYICELIRRQVASRRHDRCTDMLRNRCDLNHVIIRRTPHIYMSKDRAVCHHTQREQGSRDRMLHERG